MQTRSSSSRHVTAGVKCDAVGKPRVFTLTCERETIHLDPGLTWLKADSYKWVTRGLLEQPQSFHVQADATVEINGEKISIHDPDGSMRLEQEINKHHDLPAAAAGTVPVPRKTPAHVHPPDRVAFEVRLDRFGHLAIDCYAGEERTSTGLRGLPSLVHNELMLPPREFHVDPLQRHLEMDGERFECTEEGARQLEAALNARYAPRLRDSSQNPIEVRENPASPSGFDVRFVTTHVGARFEVKGHLSQEKLDILQDPAKSSLLQPGILLRLVPPHLLARRRRPDGGEERLPELPDLEYLRATTVQVKEFLNHPLIRRGAGAAVAATPAEREPPAIAALRVARHPQNRLSLWLESLTREGKVIEGRAFTHHNVSELQQHGVFLPQFDVALSLDHETLSLLNQETGEERHLVLNRDSPDDVLARASEWLTGTLRPPPPRTPRPELPTRAPADSGAGEGEPAGPGPEPPGVALAMVGPEPLGEPPVPVEQVPAEQVPAEPVRAPAGEPGPGPVPSADVPMEVPVEEVAGYGGHEPGEVLRQAFQAVVEAARLPLQDVRLSLPPAFSDRRFEVLSFTGEPIEELADLRRDAFSGFYLTHLGDEELLLVYAQQGRRVEFGARRCELQASLGAEPEEYASAGLLGLAQDEEGRFVFVVSPAYRAWVGSRERVYAEAGARFLTPAEVAAGPAGLTRIWPT